MSFRFCLGASGSGKSRFLHNMVSGQAQESLSDKKRVNDNYVLIVPDQYSMQTQKEIVSESPRKGILNIDVLSFGRLTHKIFEEVGVSKRAVLDDTGKTLLLRRVAGHCEKDLKLLGRSLADYVLDVGLGYHYGKAGLQSLGGLLCLARLFRLFRRGGGFSFRC